MQLSVDQLGNAVRDVTDFPVDALPLVRAALEDAFPRGATAACVCSVDGDTGMLVEADGALLEHRTIYFARYHDEAFEVRTLDSLRGGNLTILYRDVQGRRRGFSYVHPRGKIVIDVRQESEEEIRPIIGILTEWSRTQAESASVTPPTPSHGAVEPPRDPGQVGPRRRRLSPHRPQWWKAIGFPRRGSSGP